MNEWDMIVLLVEFTLKFCRYEHTSANVLKIVDPEELILRDLFLFCYDDVRNGGHESFTILAHLNFAICIELFCCLCFLFVVLTVILYGIIELIIEMQCLTQKIIGFWNNVRIIVHRIIQVFDRSGFVIRIEKETGTILVIVLNVFRLQSKQS